MEEKKSRNNSTIQTGNPHIFKLHTTGVEERKTKGITEEMVDSSHRRSARNKHEIVQKEGEE